MLGTTLIAVGVAVRVLLDSSSELLTAADDLAHPRLPWLLAAISAELASYLLYGLALRQLLRSGGALDIALLPLSAVGVAAQAAAYCVPGGLAVSGTVTYRRLSRRGVAPAMTAWMLTVSTLLYLTALVLLALVGAELAGGGSSTVPDLRLTSLLTLGLLAGITQALYLLRHRRLPGRGLRWLVHLLDSAVARRHPQQDQPATPAADWLDELRHLRIGKRAYTVTGALLMLVWLADAACLTLAFLTLGDTPPWDGLLLAYCAGQLAAMLPFTPGGLGVVEGSLTIGLVAYGGSAQSALSAVLLYRLISFWGLIPAGAGCYALLRWQERAPVSSRSKEYADA